jgi:Flp pilus assembly protein protease CpaA
VIFLLVLGLVWILFAVIQDLRKREIANWLNFSLIVFALGFRFFYSLFYDPNFIFFFYGLIGFGLFFFLGNLLYYGKVFAGGDAKLMMALGAILPLSSTLYENLNLFLVFFMLFLIAGALYGLFFSIVLGIKNGKNFKREFSKRFVKNKRFFYIALGLSFILIILSFFVNLLFYLGILIFISPYLYFSAKTIDKVCMIKEISVEKLTEGDWLYKNIRAGKKIIKANWDGLTKEDIKLIKKKYKKVLIRQGIPFSPVFLVGYIIWICVFEKIF